MRQILSFFLCFLLVFGCVSTQIDRSAELEALSTQLVSIDGDFTWRFKDTEGEPAAGKVMGVAFSIGDGYFASAYHVFQTDTVMINSPFGRFMVPIDVVEPLVLRCAKHEYEIVAASETLDLIILKSCDGFAPPAIAPFLIGKVRLGEESLIVGRPRLGPVTVRIGHVSCIGEKEMFTVTNDFAPGDSGSPIFVNRGNKWLLAGVAKAVDYPTNSYGIVVKASYLEAMFKVIKTQEKG